MTAPVPTRFSVVLNEVKDLIAAGKKRALQLLAMRSFAALRMTGKALA
jgi:hypothetical protein